MALNQKQKGLSMDELLPGETIVIDDELGMPDYSKPYDQLKYAIAQCTRCNRMWKVPDKGPEDTSQLECPQCGKGYAKMTGNRRD